MANKKENQMFRSTSQALYKYVPLRWIDFYFSQSRRGITAFVDRWSSLPLEDINKKRLLRRVSEAVDSYRSQNGAVFVGGENACLKNVGSTISEETYTVLTPRVSEFDRAIAASVSPKVFFCEKCRRVQRFKRDSHYSYIIKQNCKHCGGNLVQLRDIYYCKCGWAGDVTIGSCDMHKDAPVRIDIRKHTYECTVCHRSTAIFRLCPECNTKIRPNNVLDSAQSFVKSLSVIDLLDPKMDDFLTQEEEGAVSIVANYLDLIGASEFKKLVKYGRSSQKEIKNESYESLLKTFLDQGMPQQYAEMAAKAACKVGESDPIEQAIKKANTYIDDISKMNAYAELLLEYNAVKYGEDIVDLDTAIERAKELNAFVNVEKLKAKIERRGFTSMQACDRIPFLQCSYGFTREYVDSASAPTNNMQPVVLHGFPDENAEKKNVYATKLQTEGVLFEIDRVKILKWLLKNSVIKETDLPVNIDDEIAVKAWFINHINLEAIQPFSLLSAEEDAITYYVYRLVHTISHTLIIAAAEVCGLDKNSLSEYIFPNVPAIFIYCQNSQGFNMGALFSVFEMYLDKWLDNSYQAAKECVFDPVCREGDAACTGCIFTNEISCQHFNHDLDRNLLTGKMDKKTETRFYGFWED